MTRETKVGLLVGLGMILFIGIIVSEQLSSTKNQASPDLTDFASRAQRSVEPNSAPPPELPNASMTDAMQPMAASPATPTLTMGEIPGAIPGALPGAGAPVAPTPVANQLPAEPVGPAPAVSPAPSVVDDQPTPPSVASTMVHHVQRGESPYTLARRYYGNGELATVIIDANRDKLDARGRIREGVRLTIPSRPDLASATQTPADSASATPAPRTIKVAAKDNLSKLAQKHLGASSRWQELLDANRDKLRRAEDLKIGMELRLPAPPPADAAAESESPAPESASTTSTPSNGDVALVSTTQPAQTATPAVGGLFGNAPTPAPAAASAKTYTVQHGDTLYSIARQVYGTSRRWNDLLQANKQVLGGQASKLKPGQKLVVP